MTSPLIISTSGGGGLLELRLNRPKANIIDAAMIAALDASFATCADKTDLKAVMLCAEGAHFSFGASVEEHLPGSFRDMIAGLHALLKRMLFLPLPILVAIRGSCLGGGLEVALAGHRLFAAPDAKLGQPEMMLGVFAPAASCLMPARVGQAAANDLLWTGRSVGGKEALALGLVDTLDPDPEGAARAWFDGHLAPKSASSLRFAVRASQTDYARRIAARLDEVERVYVNELMTTHDAVEGLTAFTEKRPAEWKNR